MTRDTIVLGAGIVGVSVALHLQARGRSVVLMDRREPGSETSHGNAGLIERSSVIPYAFPRDLASIIAYASNRSTAVRYRASFLPRILPWLAQYWRYSSPGWVERIAREMLPLIERCVAEHEEFVGPAGASSLVRPDGWIDLHRTQSTLDQAAAVAGKLGDFKLTYDVLDGAGLRGCEPDLLGDFAGAVHWRDPASVADPGAVTRAYADLFVGRGGGVVRGDASSLVQNRTGWSVKSDAGSIEAEEAVVALGPWSGDICSALGYRFPLAVKRGYHMHYTPQAGAQLRHPVCDSDAGFVLTSMTRGVRLTSGVELAARDAPPTPDQIKAIEPIARGLFPLGAQADDEAWMGSRPCLPDMKPIIGPAPRHRGLWFAFGHAHHGFTLGPVTGRLLAEMMSGAKPFTDPTPYAAQRFRA